MTTTIEPRRQRSAPDAGPEPVDRNAVLMFANGIDHGPACGERVPCPSCGSPLGELYNVAERQVRRDGTFILCHSCHGTWRELAA